MTTLRTASKVAAAATVIGAAALSAAPATAASNDWHRVSTKTFVNFCSDHHDRTGASFIVSNSSGKTVGAASARVCWGGGHVGVWASSEDDAADGKGVRAQIRYRVWTNGHWSGYHYRNLAVNRRGKNGGNVVSHAYSANHGTKGVVVRVELFNKYGHVTAVGPWR